MRHRRIYLDHARPTGAAIGELFPAPPVATRLLLGQMAADTVDVVGPGGELAFIDGDHRHPWALLDLLALLPVLAPSSHVLMHDLHLCTSNGTSTPTAGRSTCSRRGRGRRCTRHSGRR